LGKRRVSCLLGFTTLFGVLILCVFWSLSVGEAPISIRRVFSVLGSLVWGNPDGFQAQERLILLDIRLPRVVSALLVGACLSTSGVIYQGLLMNVLAEPYTLGVATGAAFGASLAFLLGLRPVAIYAFVGGAASLLISMALAGGSKGIKNSPRLILAGVVVSSILSAGITLLKALAGQQASVIVFWLLGSFSSADWSQVFLVFASAMAVLTVGLFYSREMDIIASGGPAEALGVDEGRTKLALLFLSSLATSVAVSTCGVIGFVGLVVPHLLRLIFGPGHRGLVVLAFLGGGILLVVADTFSRMLGELPIGVLTALTGGPVFCFLLWKGR